MSPQHRPVGLRPRAASSRAAVVLAVAIVGVVGVVFVLLREKPAGDQRDGAAVFRRGAVTWAPGVHMLGELSPSVVYVIETGEGLVLIDAGLEDDCELLLDQLFELGLDPAEIRAVIITHAHGDHYQGASWLRKATGATIHAGSRDCDVIRAGGPRDAVFSTYQMPEIEIIPTEVDVELNGGEVLVFGDTSLEIIATPGHTPGSICIGLQRDGKRFLFTGDTVTSLTAELGTYAAYLPPRYRGDAREYLATLRRLRRRPAPDYVLPGHPDVLSGRVTPQVSAAEWHALLDRGIVEMETLVRRYAEDGADFLDGTPKELVAGVFYLGDAAGYPVYCVETPRGLLLFDAPTHENFTVWLEPQLAHFGLALQDIIGVIVTSAEPSSVDGLRSLTLHNNHPYIIGPEELLSRLGEGLERGRMLLPEEAEALGIISIEPIPLRGLGGLRTGYQFERDGELVLVTGEFLERFVSRAEIDQFIARLARSGSAAHFRESIDRLRAVNPDLWLTARPKFGQNANLYGGEWDNIINDYRIVMRDLVERP